MLRALVVIQIAALAAAAPAAAAPGSLDPSFGGDGRVVTPFPADPEAEATAVAAAGEGRVLAAGTVRAEGRGQFGIARYEPDGDLDSGFGLGGLRLTDFGLSTEARALAMAAMPDRGAVVVGSVSFSGQPAQLALARYDADGNLDDDFGAGGVVITNVISNAEAAHAVTVQPDGRIVVAGVADNEVLVARYSPAGALDASFGTGGIVRTAVPGALAAQATGVALQPDGAVVVGGTAVFNPEEDRVLALRYRPNGVLDVSFGTQGFAAPSLGSGDERGNAVGMGPDGRITLAGGTTFEDTGFLLARLTADGELDGSFGAGRGYVVRRVGSAGTDVARALVVQPDGKAIAVGTAGLGAGPVQWGLVRVDRTGRLDETFGGDGVVTTEVIEGGLNSANAAALQTDGRIVVAGSAQAPGARGDFAVARYRGDEADLSIEVASATPRPVRPSRRLTYELTVSNAGPETAEEVVVRLDLPAPFVGARPTRGSCARTADGDRVACRLGALAAGAEPVGIKLVVRPAEQGTLTLRAAVDSLTFDPASGNDTADQTVEAEGNADIRRPRITLADIVTSSRAAALRSGRIVLALASNERGAAAAEITAGRGRQRITIAEMEGALPRANRRRRLSGELTREGRRYLQRNARVILSAHMVVRDATGNERRRIVRERLR